ncbi:MAG: excinuclease ABC subunit UvrA [Raoultibacter sp.]
MAQNAIVIKGAREHNLKNIDLSIPRDKLVVITGLSGSGKSSLAFDTIYAEGQRRYVESLSSYARQFLGQMNKPDLDSIDGLSPAVSIDQKTTSKNPRSTVGTVTEIYDYLRLLFARVGIPHCPECGRVIRKQTTDQVTDEIIALGEGAKSLIMAPVVIGRKGEFTKLFADLQSEGFTRVRVDGMVHRLDGDPIELNKKFKHTIDVVVDRVVLKQNAQSRIAEAVELATKLADGRVLVHIIAADGEADNTTTDHLFSLALACPEHGHSIDELQPRDFSFNAPYGACPDCLGLGSREEIDPSLIVPDPSLSLNEGVIAPFTTGNYYPQVLRAVAKHMGVDADTAWEDMAQNVRDALLFGIKGEKVRVDYVTVDGRETYWFVDWEGACAAVMHRYQESTSDTQRERLEEYFAIVPCQTCGGKRLKPEILAVTVGGKNIHEVCVMSAADSCHFFENLHFEGSAEQIAGPIVKEIRERLRDLGNTVIVVEHDEDTILSADYVIDMGPGAGEHGGQVVAAGTPKHILKAKNSYTADYLSGRKKIEVPQQRRVPKRGAIKLIGATENNLKNVSIDIPLGALTVVTGVSGSGKSSLITDTLAPVLANRVNRARRRTGAYAKLTGANLLDKVINIDQSPIGRTPRSNPATYIGLWDDIRSLFASTQESKAHGYAPGRFSFNVSGGRCEACKGDGQIKIEMHFLPDVYVPCEVCGGKRYNRETLQVTYRGKNVYDVLEMTVDEGLAFFEKIPSLKRKLQTLHDVGLGYIRLGQPATTLSGGEAQRVKLSSELQKRQTGKTFYILDEPTTGLHFEDVRQLLIVLQRLVEHGNTVLIIEHNLDVIKCADTVIDLGPEGGNRGGEIVAVGTPEVIAACEKSYTGQFLRKIGL